MHLLVIGLNHKTAPVELREKLSIDDARLPDVLASMQARGQMSECLILSTCNRTEVYAYTAARTDGDSIVDWLGELCGVSVADLASHVYSQAGHKAAEHLFRVAAGIDSMVVGEAQILGQVKNAYSAAVGIGSTGPVLNALFQQAIVVGKRARTETEIGRGSFSVGSVAVQLAKSIFDDMKGRAVLIVGAGEMAELTITHLISSGTTTLLVTNRTYEKAVRLADQFDGKAVKFEELPRALESADVVITSTGAPDPVITRAGVASAMRARRGRPVFFIDIAVPRDVEQGVGDIDNVFVYDIDDLESAIEADTAGRRAEIAKVGALISDELDLFMTRFRTFDAVPVISAMRDKFEEIRLAEVERLVSRLRHLSAEDMEIINTTTRSIVNKICHQPMIQVKEYANGENAPAKLDMICELFGICPVDNEGEKREETSEGESKQ